MLAKNLREMRNIDFYKKIYGKRQTIAKITIGFSLSFSNSVHDFADILMIFAL
jgi:hypothetical protein